MKNLPKVARKATIDRILQNQATPWAVLIIALIITGLAWHIADQAVDERIAERFEHQAEDIVTAISKRMQEYEVVLRSGLGLFKASEAVTREEWKAFTDNLNIEKYYPGIQGIGFSLMVPPEKKEEHERAIQAEGFPDYQIKPDGERDMYSAIIYLEPFDWRNQRAFGYDMFSQETRREAMERARDTGRAAMSGRLTLVQETKKDVQYGFLLYLPLYQKDKILNTVQQRQKELVGYVYSPFRVRDLMQGILLIAQEDISFEIYDSEIPSPETILYNHAASEEILYNNKPHRPRYDGVYNIIVAGRVWSLYLYSKPEFSSQGEANQPLFIAFGGILFDIMLFFIVFINARKRNFAEALAKERTIELEEKSKELARSNDELEQFVYTVSHDLKSPLVTSMGFISIVNKLAKRGDYKKALEKLPKVVEANNRMGQLINDLVELSRVGRIDLDKKQLDMNTLLHKLKEENRRRFHNAEITIIIKENLPLIYGNESRVLQIFENLLSNALKYAIKPEGSIVTIGGRINDNQALFYVKDDGPGIEPDFHEKIFGLFQRLDNSIEGTGIGLAVVKKVMQFHGGKVWVEATPEEGATFWLSFPTEQTINNT